MMKKIIFLFLLFSSLVSGAQQLQWEKVIQTSYNDDLWTAFQLSDGRIFIQSEQKKSRSTNPENHITLVEWDGSSYTDMSYSSDRWTEVNQLSGGGIWLIGVGLRHECGDDVFYGNWNYQKIDPEVPQDAGVIYNTESGGGNGASNFPAGSFLTSSGDIVSAGQARFEHITIAGNELVFYSSFDTLSNPVIGLFPFYPDLGIAFSHDALFTMDINGVMSQIAPFPFFVDSVSSTLNKSEFLLFSQDTVRLCDTSGVIHDQIIATDFIDTVYQVSHIENQFWIMGTEAGQLVLNTYENGNLVSTFQPDTAKADFRRFVAEPLSNRFMLIGYETAVDNDHLLLQMFSPEATSFTKSNFNLAITSAEIVSVIQPGCFDANVYEPTVKLTIKNNSALPVNSFFINGKWDDVFIFNHCVPHTSFCMDPQFGYIIEETILPGDTTQIEVMLIFGSPSPLPVCFWVSSPDMQPDRDPSDDKICIDIDVSVSISEFQNNGSVVKTYPVPARDLINFQLPESWANKSYSSVITDIAGHEIKEKNGNGMIICYSVHDLPDGLYFAVFKSGDGDTITKSFVVSK